MTQGVKVFTIQDDDVSLSPVAWDVWKEPIPESSTDLHIMWLINTYIYMNMHTHTLLIKIILSFFWSETTLNLFYISQWLTHVRQRLYHCAISTIFCIYFVFLTHCIYLYLLYILRHCLTILSGLDLNSLCCPGRPWSCNLLPSKLEGFTGLHYQTCLQY